MHEIRDSETVPYTAGEMFDLVADVERYKEFLPWCRESRIVSREKDDVVIAELRVGYGPLHTAFTTRNTLRKNKAVEMTLVEGPFEVLEGNWHFVPLQDSSSRMSLDMRFNFTHRRLEAPFNHVFKAAMETLVRAFKDRAAELYGPRDPGCKSHENA